MTSTGLIHVNCKQLNGDPARGSVQVLVNTTDQQVRDPAGNIVFSGPVTIKLVEGEATFTVPATNDPALSPTGFTYTTIEQLEHVARADYRTVTFAVPTGVTVHTADVPTSDEVAVAPSYSSSGAIPLVSASSGTAHTVTAPEHGESRVKLTLTGNATLTLSGGTAGEVCALQLHLIQDATGSRTVTWPSNLDWGVNGPPVLSTTVGKTDRVYLTTDNGGVSWQGAIIGGGYSTPVAPSAPTSLGATVVSGDVQLDWTQGAANGATVTQNKVYRGTSSGVLTLLATISAGTTYTDTTPLEDGTTYFYKVSSVNSVGEGALSSEVSAVPGLLIVAADDFSRADAAGTTPTDGLIGKTTPTGGKTWSNITGSGTWSNISGKAVCSGSNRKAGIDAGVHAATWSGRVASTGAAADHGMYFWEVDANNYCDVIIDPGGYYVQKTVGGTQTNVASGGGAVGADSDVVLTISAAADGTIVVKANGTTVVTTSITDGVFATATKGGFLTGGNANAAFDSLQVTSP